MERSKKFQFFGKNFLNTIFYSLVFSSLAFKTSNAICSSPASLCRFKYSFMALFPIFSTVCPVTAAYAFHAAMSEMPASFGCYQMHFHSISLMFYFSLLRTVFSVLEVVIFSSAVCAFFTASGFPVFFDYFFRYVCLPPECHIQSQFQTDRNMFKTILKTYYEKNLYCKSKKLPH